jgi:RecA-family ATPase
MIFLSVLVGDSLEINDVSTYILQDLPRPEFYIEELLPKEGVMLLFGAPKAKKSWLAQYMAYCIATGQPFIGFNTHQARVMICQFEIAKRAYFWRLKDMGRRFTIPEQFLYETSPGLTYIDKADTFPPFAAAIRTIAPKIIFLDCLAACYGGDENDSGQMARFIENIDILRRENGASIVLVHHTRKAPSTGSSFADTARGQSRLAGWVDTIVHMAQQPLGIQLQILARQANREVDPVNVRFENYIWERR